MRLSDDAELWPEAPSDKQRCDLVKKGENISEILYSLKVGTQYLKDLCRDVYEKVMKNGEREKITRTLY